MPDHKVSVDWRTKASVEAYLWNTPPEVPEPHPLFSATCAGCNRMVYLKATPGKTLEDLLVCPNTPG